MGDGSGREKEEGKKWYRKVPHVPVQHYGDFHWNGGTCTFYRDYGGSGAGNGI